MFSVRKNLFVAHPELKKEKKKRKNFFFSWRYIHTDLITCHYSEGLPTLPSNPTNATNFLTENVFLLLVIFYN